jgi:DNA-binding beta-propeller fold protein YncE
MVASAFLMFAALFLMAQSSFADLPTGRVSDVRNTKHNLSALSSADSRNVQADTEGNVYIIKSFHDYLLIHDQDARFLLPIGSTGSGIGQFYLPAGVWSDSQNRIYVADMFNGRVAIFQYLRGEGRGDGADI